MSDETKTPEQVAHEQLVAGLVGPDHRELYEGNAYFFNSVNNLAVLFRPMVDGLATAAAEQMREDESQLNAMRQAMAAGMETRPVRNGHMWPCPAYYVGGDDDACDCGGGHGE